MGVEVVLGMRLGVDGGGGVMGKVEKVNASRIGCGGDEVVFLRTVLILTMMIEAESNWMISPGL